VDTFCYLGYHITNKHSFSDDEEIEKRCQKMRVRASMVASRFKYACADVKSTYLLPILAQSTVLAYGLYQRIPCYIKLRLAITIVLG